MEDGADVGDLVGKEGEGVFLLLVDGIEGVALNALAVGGVVDAQRTGFAAVDAIPGDREHARVAVGSRCVIGVIEVEGVRPGMRVSGREHRVTAPPEGDKELVKDGSALLPLPGADRGQRAPLDGHVLVNLLRGMGTARVRLVGIGVVALSRLAALEERDETDDFVRFVEPGGNDLHLIHIVRVVPVDDQWAEAVDGNKPGDVAPIVPLLASSAAVLYPLHHLQHEVSVHVLRVVQAPHSATVGNGLLPDVARDQGVERGVGGTPYRAVCLGHLGRLPWSSGRCTTGSCRCCQGGGHLRRNPG